MYGRLSPRALAVLFGCALPACIMGGSTTTKAEAPGTSPEFRVPAPRAPQGPGPGFYRSAAATFQMQVGTAAEVAIAELVKKHGEPNRARIERGTRQVAMFWRQVDGTPAEMGEFAKTWFVKGGADEQALLSRFSKASEQLDGHMLEIGRALRSWAELEIGPQLPIDELLAAYDPGAHVAEDFFQNKLAFVGLLNFPLVTLDEMQAQGKNWSREQWAGVRLARRFALRPSGAAQTARAKASADAEAYIAGDNLWMHHLLSADGSRLFSKNVRLISHWNLRDQIKAEYAAGKEGLLRQRLILQAMNRIVDQSIPLAVLDDPRVDWDPVANTVKLAPADETETPTASQGKRGEVAQASTAREPDTRYAMLLETFNAARQSDLDSPLAATEIDRRFQLDSELPEQRVVQLFEQVLGSPLIPRVAKLIEARLGRPLEPQDIWYAGFLARAQYTEEALNKITRARYANAAAYKKDIPRLLGHLGFASDKAAWLDSHIVVDPARGAGHALEAARRDNLLPNWGAGDNPHLRTRINADGMDYKGYNIAVHEMGHNVEQSFSLYEVDDTLLSGVPGTSFTEALAFTFQNRDLELLGLAKPDEKSEQLRVLNDFWATYEIAGVALVDLAVWHWMYAHPDCTPAQLREATVSIAKEMWNKWYAPVLGGKDSPQLAIYSHMISSFLYLPNYPLGHLIAFQLEGKLKGANSGAEFERVARFGHVSPDLWMEHATGKPVVAEPLLEAAKAAIEGEEKSPK